MDIDFRERPIEYLQEQAVEVLYQEETAELIVPDSSPDVRAVVDSSAVCCLRDQEVQAGSLAVSGAFQGMILYTAEGEEQPHWVDAYLPFSAKLSREEIRDNSRATAELRIRSVDARILNSRKLLLRVSYAVRLCAYGPAALPLWDTEQGDPVQLLRTTEVGFFPVSAGEKQTSFSEPVELPQAGGEVRRILKAVPEIQTDETAVAEDRVVVKGAVSLHLVYLLESGQLAAFDVQLPVSQYIEMDGDLSGGKAVATASLTDFQLEEEESGGYLATVGLRLQAVVWKRLELPLIADGYCAGNEFEAQFESFRVRQLLDEPVSAGTAEAALSGQPRKLIDCTAWVDFPVCRRGKDEVTAGTAVTMHALYYNEEGLLCGETVRAEESGTFALCDGAVCMADTDRSGSCFVSMGGAGGTISCPVTIRARCFAEKPLQTIRAAFVGEPLPDAADRPSLIVRRAGSQDRLWDLAKAVGSTVRAIREANGLEDDSMEEGALLLIPIA